VSAEGREGRTLDAARQVAALLEELGIETALIGAMALAAHRYIRYTEDVDLATAVDPVTSLGVAVDALRNAGFEAALHLPDAQDPLGGVINIDRDDIERIQVVNFLNPWNDLALVGQEAVRTATLLPGETLRVVDLSHLIALKLYAGGSRSKTDVIELLERNLDAELDEIRQVCGRFGLGAALDELLEDLQLE
jgi:hypothetical protein